MSPKVFNRLLSTLTPKVRESLLAQSTPVPLPVRVELYSTEHAPQFAYFITSGLASIVSNLQDGSTAEVGILGNEGIACAMHLLGPAIVSTSSFMQLEGTALRIPLSRLKKIFQSSEEARSRILEYIQVETLTISQSAACNRLHNAEERLARWLLMTADRVQSDTMMFTQEFLGLMVGARRTTVTLVAGALQRSGLIEYRRGEIKIINRENLEAAACGCYQVSRQLLANLYTQNWQSSSPDELP